MNQEELSYLISQYLQGKATPEEEEQLLNWYRNNEPETVEWVSDDVNELQQVKERVAAGLTKHITTSKKKRFSIGRIAAAASILILISAGVYLLSLKPVEYLTVSTPTGKIRQLQLPDGSVVWLNAATTIRYPKSFNQKRTIELDGEAYFDVKSSAGEPFIVVTRSINTRVLGTAFNVKSYSKENKILVAVAEGKVQVADSSSTLATIQPRQRLTYNLQDGKGILSKVNNADAFSWKDGELSFDTQPLEAIALVLERWYNVRFEFKDQVLKSCTYSATFNSNKPLNEILTLLCDVNNIHFNIDETNRIVKLWGRGCQ
ncbi:DUF4974 domain-containing protein [Chitinophaga silvatica]|uniref:DUF4974 domain-containing protein n=1 Tax=Chitinophaga silvatica TaxID=2282649 RepID=A0A3E1YE05_9BACT|nr:FecR domain-containing protein [Chitinophaga silvatica]RFS24729.1 DUF4974 domain-containing protein [Chitinophaga silvatica]